MNALSRARYHLTIAGLDTLWLPAAAGLGFWLLVLNGGDAIQNRSALLLWSEVLLPGIAGLLCAYSASPAGDPARDLVFTSPRGAARVYLERYALLISACLLLSLGLGWLISATVLPELGWPAAVQATLLGLPPLLLFSALALLAAGLSGGPAGGAALAGGAWLLLLLGRSLASHPVGEWLYPFAYYFEPGPRVWLANRLLVLVLGLALLLGFVAQVLSRPRPAPRLSAQAAVLLVLPLAISLGAGYLAAGRPAPSPYPAGSREDRWAQDLRFIERELPRRHANAFHSQTPERFAAAVDRLEKDLSQLSDEQIVTGLMRLVAGVGDAHTELALWKVTGWHIYPLRLRWFSDGLYVIAAAEPYGSVAGSRVERIGELTPEEALRRVGPLISPGSPARLRQRSPEYLVSVEVLQATGILGESEGGRFTLVDGDGRQSELTLPALAVADAVTWVAAPGERPAYEQQAGELYWLEVLAEEGILYFKYNACEGRREFARFNQALWQIVDQQLVELPPIERLVIDLRGNRGGNSAVFRPFLEALSRHPELNHPERLFVLIDGSVFSSALLNAAELRRDTQATFIGEQAGDYINHYGEVRSLRLPNSGLMLRYSTHKFSVFLEGEAYLHPDVLVATHAADYFAGRDPVFGAVILRGVP